MRQTFFPPQLNDMTDLTSAQADQVSRVDANEISTLLFIHEKKGGAQVPGQNEESSSSDSDDDNAKKSISTAGRQTLVHYSLCRN